MSRPIAPSSIEVALAAIAKQSALVGRLSPGSRDHKLASEVLFALQDSCAALMESHVLLEKLRRASISPAPTAAAKAQGGLKAELDDQPS